MMAERKTRFDTLVEQEEKKVKEAAKENPFTRSTQTLKKAAGNQQTTQTDNKSSSEIESNVLEKNKKLDVKSMLADRKKITSKTYSLYLDSDVYDKLAKAAKSNKMSVSKALNELLRSIL